MLVENLRVNIRNDTTLNATLNLYPAYATQPFCVNFLNSLYFLSSINIQEELTMADFKLCIADPKSQKTYHKEVKDQDASSFIGKNIGETLKGEVIGLTGYGLTITGGSDNCGFPMRKGILGVRKKLSLMGGVGLRKRLPDGVKKRKTVCGHKIGPSIVQINLKVTKAGSKSLDDLMGDKDAAPEGEAPKDGAEAPKEEKKEDKPEEKKEEPKPKEEKKEAKPEEKPVGEKKE